MFSLTEHTIYVTLAGSQAQGTASDESDVDLRGVCIAPLETRLSLFQNFEQIEDVLPTDLGSLLTDQIQRHPTARRGLAHKVESVIYDVAKFLKLCAVANPNALEILFADRRDWLLTTPAWERIYEHKERFVTEKVKDTFLGYALAQLRRIRGHRSWLQNPPEKKPERDDFPAGEGAQYKTELKHWNAYQTWKTKRNPARAVLEAKYGYDTKHAMHLVRMMRMGLSALKTGQILVRRPDAAELIRIREGALTYDQLVEQAEQLQAEIEAASQQSTLPTSVDEGWLDGLLYDLCTAPS